MQAGFCTKTPKLRFGLPFPVHMQGATRGTLRRMRKATKWARVAVIVAAVAKIIATPWGAAMTTLVALASAVGVWFADWQHVQYWSASLATFVAIVWAAAGIVWLGTRSAPQFVRLHQDYRYSLTFEQLIPNYDPNDPERALSFGIQLRNFSGGPLRYVVEEFDVRVGRRALPRVKKDHLKSVMARGAGRTSTTEPFTAEDIKDLLGKSKRVPWILPSATGILSILQ